MNKLELQKKNQDIVLKTNDGNDDNVVAFYCNNCHEIVWNCEHKFEQLHEKGLCAKCLKKQNKTKDRWQKLKEWLEKAILRNKDNIISKYDYENVLVIMQELEGEDE